MQVVVDKVQNGWIVGVLRLGRCGYDPRKVLYRTATLRRAGIDPESDPDAPHDKLLTIGQYLVDAVMPDELILGRKYS